MRRSLGDDLLGVWLIGGTAQGAYQHGVSDVDVLAVSNDPGEVAKRQSLGDSLVHPTLPCPAVGLEFVWYALPDLVELDDPVKFQLNVNGGPERDRAVQIGPDDSPNWWSVLDLAAARQAGVPLVGPRCDQVVPPVPADRVRQAILGSLDWHDGPAPRSDRWIRHSLRRSATSSVNAWADPRGLPSRRAGRRHCRSRR